MHQKAKRMSECISCLSTFLLFLYLLQLNLITQGQVSLCSKVFVITQTMHACVSLRLRIPNTYMYASDTYMYDSIFDNMSYHRTNSFTCEPIYFFETSDFRISKVNEILTINEIEITFMSHLTGIH